MTLRARHVLALTATLGLSAGCADKALENHHGFSDGGGVANDASTGGDGAGGDGGVEGMSDGTGSDGGADDGDAGGHGPHITGAYEGEDAFSGGTGSVQDERPGFSGAGYVDGLGPAGARLIFAVNAASDGPASVRFRHAGPAKTLAVRVNGKADGILTLPKQGEFSAYEATLTLRRGLNTIMLVNEGEAGEPVSIDRLELDNDALRPERGAMVPFDELEAEDGVTNGSTLGPDVTPGTLAASASGRRAVLLAQEGSYVEWTAPAAANALTVRFSLPDAPGGGGTDGSISLYVDSRKRQTLAVSSRRAWLYGDWVDGQGFSNVPQAQPMMQFIEERFLVGDIPALEDAFIADIVRDGAAVKVSTQFSPLPFAGTTRIERVELRRGGSIEPANGGSVGSLRFAVWEKAIEAPVVRDVRIADSSHDAVEFTHTNPVRQTTFQNVLIEGAGGHGIKILTPGDGTFENVIISNTLAGAADISAGFALVKVGGSGW